MEIDISGSTGLNLHLYDHHAFQLNLTFENNITLKLQLIKI